MNNKYDVTNFSKLIDNFDKDKEMALVQSEVEQDIAYARAHSQHEMVQQIFDPIIPKMKDFEAAKKQSKYELAKFKGKRYDMSNLHARLLECPPHSISQYRYKEEVLNYVLDKAFIEMPIKEEFLMATQQCLAN
jgi:hypothetical protein